MYIIGDVHGKISGYLDLLRGMDSSVAVGDIGFDYSRVPMSDNHRFFKGNHDNYGPDGYHPNDLGDFGPVPGIDKSFFMRGAYSIDCHLRVIGRDWFPNEQLSYFEAQKAIETYKAIRPEIVLSHDCPISMLEVLHPTVYGNSTTQAALEAMFEFRQPRLWIFGHHHKSMTTAIGRTRFVCLGELEACRLTE